MSKELLTSKFNPYPIGSIYLSVTNVNPSTYFGGKWESWGAGRVLTGVNANDSDFNVVEKTGGNKSINLSHSHTVNSHTHSTASHTLTVDEMPTHDHKTGFHTATQKGTNDTMQDWRYLMYHTNINGYNSGFTHKAGGGKAHSHGNTGSASPATNSSLGNTSVVQPYITCYMWKRIA